MKRLTKLGTLAGGFLPGFVAGLWILATELVYSHLVLPYPVSLDGRLLFLYALIAIGLGLLGFLIGVPFQRFGRVAPAATVGTCSVIAILGLRLHDLYDVGFDPLIDVGVVLFAITVCGIMILIASRVRDRGMRLAAPTVLLALSIPVIVVGGKLLVRSVNVPLVPPVPFAFAVVGLGTLLLALAYKVLLARVARPTLFVAAAWLAPVLLMIAAHIDSSVLVGRSEAALKRVQTQDNRPPIIYIVVDTLRADHMSVNGYDLHNTPELEAFAKGATLYTRCLAQAPGTAQSVPSLLAGVTPYRHGGVTNTRRLPDEVHTLPEMLQDRGYRTIGLSANPWVSYRHGMGQGFEELRLYDTDNEFLVYDLMKLALRVAPYKVFRLRGLLPPYAYKPITGLMDDALEVLANHDGTRPLFLYVQPVDPHGPYQPPNQWTQEVTEEDYVGYWKLKTGVTVNRQQLDGIVARYDGEIAYTDAELGRFFDALRALGMFDQSMIVITSDHGEQFLDHGLWRHSNSLYQQLLHVPLIVKYPGQRSGAVVAKPVATVDIVPTILSLFGDSCDECDGRLLQERTRGTQGPIFSYVMHQNEVRPIIRSVVDSGWKLIWTEKDGVEREELFRLASDPYETRDLRTQYPEVASRLRSLLAIYEAEAGPSPEAQRSTIDPTQMEQLKALGYL